MSEAKNTALGSFAGIGYSHVSPANETDAPLPTHPLMITLTIVLSLLVLLTLWDTSFDGEAHETVPVRTEDRASLSR